MLALAVLISAAMLVWLVTDPVFGAVLDLLHRLRLEPLLLAVVLVAPLQWLRGWRFAVLLQRQPDLPDWRHFKLAAQLSFLNMALPFKVGDFSFPLLARRTVAADLLPATVAIIWCRLSDLCVVAGMLLVAGAWLITPEGHGAYRLAAAALGLFCLLLPLALAPLSSLLRAARRFRPLLRLLPASAPMPAGNGGFLALTVAIWATHSLIGYLAVLAVADDVSLLAATFAGAASNLAFALPVTGVAGLGPPQAAWTAALHLTGASWEIALASALLTYGCTLVGAIVAAAPTMAWLERPLRAAAAQAQRVGTGVSPR